MVSGRIGGVVERIVQRSEIAAIGDSCPSRVDMAVVAGRRVRQARNRLHTPTMAISLVFLDILKHIGLTFNGRIRGNRSLANREPTPEHSSGTISKRGKVLRLSS